MGGSKTRLGGSYPTSTVSSPVSTPGLTGGIMYAVIAHSGQQFRLSEGDEVTLDRIDAEVGASV